MRLQWRAFLSAAALLLAGTAAAEETIVFVRHAEKPAEGLGQLDCQGLNRSLKLPAVINAMFGKPKAIFAPDPAKQKEDGGTLFDYVRPLATIEPTAIAFGSPLAAVPAEFKPPAAVYSPPPSLVERMLAARCDKKAAASRTAVVSSDRRSNPHGSTSPHSVSGRPLRADSSRSAIAPQWQGCAKSRHSCH